jgi:hypothetical protein
MLIVASPSRLRSREALAASVESPETSRKKSSSSVVNRLPAAPRAQSAPGLQRRVFGVAITPLVIDEHLPPIQAEGFSG